jgi:inosine/xanthosine triphosphatase
MFPEEQFEVEGVSAASGVSDQPADDNETFQGAANRAQNAQLAVPDADFWVGLEGGIEDKEESMESYAWIVVRSANQVGKGKTGIFFLPPKVAALIHEGKELGEADDIVFGQTNSKQSNGAIGLLTHDVITRKTFYIDAVVFALIPFKRPELYPAN